MKRTQKREYLVRWRLVYGPPIAAPGTETAIGSPHRRLYQTQRGAEDKVAELRQPLPRGHRLPTQIEPLCRVVGPWEPWEPEGGES